MAVITRDADRGRFLARMRARPWSLAIVPLAIVCLALGVVFAAQVLYADRVLPGVTVARINVGSLTSEAAAERLQAEVARPWAASIVTATSEGRAWTTTNGALGVRPDIAAGTATALRFGKAGSLIDRLSAWADALRGQAQVPLTLQAQGDSLERWLALIASDVERSAVSGSLAVGPTGLAVTQPVIGRQLDRVATAASVLAALSLEDREIALAVRTVYPAVDISGGKCVRLLQGKFGTETIYSDDPVKVEPDYTR